MITVQANEMEIISPSASKNSLIHRLKKQFESHVENLCMKNFLVVRFSAKLQVNHHRDDVNYRGFFFPRRECVRVITINRVCHSEMQFVFMVLGDLWSTINLKFAFVMICLDGEDGGNEVEVLGKLEKDVEVLGKLEKEVEVLRKLANIMEILETLAKFREEFQTEKKTLEVFLGH
jgi:hypothetical protein